jgi:RNA polymerase sigma factor (sigma-70 family)
MQELDDIGLLRQYTEDDSEEAFAALVGRHINKVYSVALRYTRNTHQAEEITQAVFVILAKKANGLGKRVILSGWLYQTARLTSVTFLRSEIRRSRREQEAHMQSILDELPEDEIWKQIAPLLDTAMAGLNETDRHAVVLRFFDGKSMSEVGTAFGASEEAAKKRVNRALEKLRKFFTKHGVVSTTAIIAGAISANSAQAAPVALARSVTTVALAKGTAASASTLTLVKGVLKVMAWSKAKTAIVIGACAFVLATGTAYYSSFNDTDPKPTLYSILEYPPVVFEATWERELNPQVEPTNFPTGALKNSFSAVVDGDNYWFDYGGGKRGKFGDTLWHSTGHQLTKFDLKWNDPNGEPLYMTGLDKALSAYINTFITFGITATPAKRFARGWNHKKFTFTGYGGDTYTVNFVEANGLPANATVRDDENADRADQTIVYRYNGQFFGGQLPAEFATYMGDATNENFLISVYHIQSFKIYDHHLPSAELDPDKLVGASDPNYTLMFYSNNVLYSTADMGRGRRVAPAH